MIAATVGRLLAHDGENGADLVDVILDPNRPTTSGWVFYVSNLIIVAGYLTAAALIVRRKGVASGMSWRTLIGGLSFFVLCGATHIELAIHAFLNEPLIPLDGRVEWHMLVIHIVQAASIWGFLWAVNYDARGSAPIPLEGAAEPNEEEPGAGPG